MDNYKGEGGVVKMRTSYVHAPEGGPIRGRRVSHSRAAAEGVTFVVGCNADCRLKEGPLGNSRGNSTAS